MAPTTTTTVLPNLPNKPPKYPPSYSKEIAGHHFTMTSHQHDDDPKDYLCNYGRLVVAVEAVGDRTQSLGRDIRQYGPATDVEFDACVPTHTIARTNRRYYRRTHILQLAAKAMERDIILTNPIYDPPSAHILITYN